MSARETWARAAQGEDPGELTTNRLELLDAIPVPAVLVRAEDRYIVYANLAYVGLVRAAGPHDVVGQPMFRFVPPTEIDRVSEDMRDVRRGGAGSDDNRYAFQRCDGTVGVVEAYPIVFRHKGERMLLSILIDVTERVRAEKALVAAEARYREVFEYAPIGIAVQVDGRYVLVNPALVRMLGARSEDEVLGRPIAESVAPSDRERVGNAMRNTMTGGQGSTAVVFRMLDLQGREFPAEITCRRVEFDGRAASQAMIRSVQEGVGPAERNEGQREQEVADRE